MDGGITQHGERALVAEPVDYFVIIKRSGPPWARTSWTWEIRNRSEPFGIKCRGDKYASPQAAKAAGEMALKEILKSS
jgi:hypothetical protein